MIQEEFANATVLTIAHRLNTIMDSDKVLYLADGKVLEYDNPVKLSKDPSSHFFKLCQEIQKEESKKEDCPQE